MSGARQSDRPIEESLAPGAAEAKLLGGYDILCVRAPNPGPLTLSGTNTWFVDREPTWVIDPGPGGGEHLARLLRAIEARGGLGGVVLTHGHSDHRGGVEELLKAHPAPLAAGRGAAEVTLAEGTLFGPFR